MAASPILNVRIPVEREGRREGERLVMLVVWRKGGVKLTPERLK